MPNAYGTDAGSYRYLNNEPVAQLPGKVEAQWKGEYLCVCQHVVFYDGC